MVAPPPRTQRSAKSESERSAPTSDRYSHGRRDGLRLALSLLAAEEAKWAALVGRSRSWRTNATREVRRTTLRVAQQRVQTALNRLLPRESATAEAEQASALEQIGL